MNATEKQDLERRRLEGWCQTPETRIADPAGGVALLNRTGLATLYPASSEIPNLFHAYMGDPNAKTDSRHTSPSGRVYGWRWALGRDQAAFYGVLIRKRTTYVAWPLLPAVLRLRADFHTPDELFDLGSISIDAYRITQALEAAGGSLSTPALRDAAGFPTGKAQRNAYLKALDELDARLLIAKNFAADDGDTRHTLIALAHPDQLAEAEAMSEEDALDSLLRTYLPNAIYAEPRVLSRHLKVPEQSLRPALQRLVAEGAAVQSDDWFVCAA
ncbi:MAG: AlkZ-related protein [Chloroflexota bacterium]